MGYILLSPHRTFPSLSYHIPEIDASANNSRDGFSSRYLGENVSFASRAEHGYDFIYFVQPPLSIMRFPYSEYFIRP